MKILIAEDHPASALILRRKLERMGHEVVHAEDGLAAWNIVQEGEVSVVISDWMMPGLDGPELCRRIRSRTEGLYLYTILLTARGRSDDRLEGLRAGADDFMTKPPDFAELEARLMIARRILGVHETLHRQNRCLEQLATTDGLTGLKNRRALIDALEGHTSQSSRLGTPLSLVLLDIDRFKRFNDDFGHPAGDTVLQAVADVLRRSTRAHDVAARYGGEEFAVLLPTTGADVACAIAERLRVAIAGCIHSPRPVTASLGVATIWPLEAGGSDLVDRADRALYDSKRQGRDRVTSDAGFCPSGHPEPLLA